MGFDTRRIEISARLSRHNSPRDRRDDALWELFLAELAILVEDERFKPICLDT